MKNLQKYHIHILSIFSVWLLHLYLTKKETSSLDFKAPFFPLMKTSSKFLPVQLILKYTAHTYIQGWFLSLNSFNKFPWATNAESWSWKWLVAGIHRKTRQWFKPVLRRSVI
jgi:hypothetical protein